MQFLIRIWKIRSSLYSLAKRVSRGGQYCTDQAIIQGSWLQGLMCSLPHPAHFQTCSLALIPARRSLKSGSVWAWSDLSATLSSKSNHHDKVYKRAYAALQPSANLKRKKSRWLQEASDLAHSGITALYFSRDLIYQISSDYSSLSLISQSVCRLNLLGSGCKGCRWHCSARSHTALRQL